MNLNQRHHDSRRAGQFEPGKCDTRRVWEWAPGKLDKQSAGQFEPGKIDTWRKDEGHLAYVLEESVPLREDPKSPRERFSFSGSRHPLQTTNLQSLTASGPIRESSTNSDEKLLAIYMRQRLTRVQVQ